MNIFTKGYLTNLAESIRNGEKIEKSQRLTTAQLKRISTIYGHLAKKYDLFELLFEKPNQELEVDGTVINTRDLANFTDMAHTVKRGYYWKPIGSATSDPSTNNGVPLAFEGARRIFGKTYMSWLTDLDVKDYMRCDIFLPFGLSSYTINEEGEAVVTDKPGLIRYYASREELDWKISDIHDFRQAIGNWNYFKPRVIIKSRVENQKLANAYNNSNSPMRCLLLQAWCWHGRSRCKDMITDFRNWDNFMVDADETFEGLRPKTQLEAASIFNLKGTAEDLKIKEFIEEDDLIL